MTNMDVLRVVTYNVYGPANPDWERRHRLIRDALRALDADVLALQEVPVVDQAFLDDLVEPGHRRAATSGNHALIGSGRLKRVPRAGGGMRRVHRPDGGSVSSAPVRTPQTASSS
jgi:endonuclease/exonuclease/phosphatase family metal-dependent hydrolase